MKCVRILAGMVGFAAPSPAISQAGPVPPGTYELVWFTRHTVTDTSIRSRVLLVLSPDAIPDSLASHMSQAVRYQPTRGHACWRLIEGALPMGARGPIVTDWPSLARDTIAITLWFSVDAGSRLRLWHDGQRLRGDVFSSGWMVSTSDGRAAPRQLHDSVLASRLGEPDARRCLS